MAYKDEEMRSVMTEACKDNHCGKSLMILYLQIQEELAMLRQITRSFNDLSEYEVFATLSKQNQELVKLVDEQNDILINQTNMINDLRKRMQKLENEVRMKKTTIWDVLDKRRY